MRGLKHSEVIELTNAISKSKVLNLDISIRELVAPAASVMRNVGDEVAIHVLCCNEYGLITGLASDLDMPNIRQELKTLQSALHNLRETKVARK